MKKNVVNLVNEIVNSSKELGIAQLITEDDHYNGREITIAGKKLLNFGSCSYLGLELDERLKNGAIQAIQKFGVQFSSSRSYVRCTLYNEAEDLVGKIFNAPIALSTNVSIGHHGVMPIVVEEDDAIILDQQVHASVQDAAVKMKAFGVKVTTIRHNDLDHLKEKIEDLQSTSKKIWYMLDGVYSMYGDFAPIEDLVKLLSSYEKLHLYIDDAHGMGAFGDNGEGYILSKVKMHAKMIVGTSLNKAFAAGGGVFVFPTQSLCDKVKNCGGSFMFSGPHQIAQLGAMVASAKIFLSTEIGIRQSVLNERIAYCHALLERKGLPVVSNPETPIFFIGLGLVRVGHNMVQRVINDGCYVNISAFPAVPETCTGIRFTITWHHTKKDIEKLVDTIAYHFPLALSEEGRSMEDIFRAFRKVSNLRRIVNENFTYAPLSDFQILHYQSINEISKEKWNSYFEKQGNMDWLSLSILEKSFRNNQQPENNWDFHYYFVNDRNGKTIVATFFTIAITKEDMVDKAIISKKIESERKRDPYYLSALTMMMGSLLTEGDHLYLDRTCEKWKQAMMLLLDNVWKEQDKHNATLLNLRDFNPEDLELRQFFKDQGFLPLGIPPTHVVSQTKWENPEAYLQSLSSDQRYYVRKKALAFESYYDVKINVNPTSEETSHYYSLYKNVSHKSFEISGFDLPEKLFSSLIADGSFEVIELRLKSAVSCHTNQKPIGVAINRKTKDGYTFLLTGMDYNYLEQYNLYPQILWQIVRRANELNAKSIELGLTASQNKRKFGAKVIEKMAYVQMKDTYNRSIIELISTEAVPVN
ncbi:MAG TPA: aminotransferase class I/II-fold pyridoxal phosphate-dependent enzyme [Cytophagaceae bacterium]|jgi:7-keto-8-aminopelargonate synthetase-like enzyme